MWTLFWDVHSGGRQKEKWSHIYIEAPKKEAKVIFYNHFGHNPERVTCTCCGEDYSISSSEWLDQLTGFHRGCRALNTPRHKNGLYEKVDDPILHRHYWLEKDELPPEGYEVESDKISFMDYIPLEDYLKLDSVMVIYAEDKERNKWINTGNKMIEKYPGASEFWLDLTFSVITGKTSSRNGG